MRLDAAHINCSDHRNSQHSLPQDATFRSVACESSTLLHRTCCRVQPFALLVVSVSDSSDAAAQRAAQNMLATYAYWKQRKYISRLTWCTIAYDNRANSENGAWQRLASTARNLSVPLHLYNGTLPANAYHPKQIYHFHRVLPLLRSQQQDAVWFLDSDIALRAVNLTQFFWSWLCAFPGGSPLLSHGTVRQEHQKVWAHNDVYWQEHEVSKKSMLGPYKRPAAIGLNFMDIQMPIWNASFFIWYMMRFGGALAAAQDIHGSDWGSAKYICPAAVAYTRTVLKGTTCAQACAVIITPFDHDNTKTATGNKLFRNAGKTLSTWLDEGIQNMLVEATGQNETSSAWTWFDDQYLYDIALVGKTAACILKKSAVYPEDVPRDACSDRTATRIPRHDAPRSTRQP